MKDDIYNKKNNLDDDIVTSQEDLINDFISEKIIKNSDDEDVEKINNIDNKKKQNTYKNENSENFKNLNQNINKTNEDTNTNTNNDRKNNKDGLNDDIFSNNEEETNSDLLFNINNNDDNITSSDELILVNTKNTFICDKKYMILFLLLLMIFTAITYYFLIKSNNINLANNKNNYIENSTDVLSDNYIENTINELKNPNFENDDMLNVYEKSSKYNQKKNGQFYINNFINKTKEVSENERENEYDVFNYIGVLNGNEIIVEKDDIKYVVKLINISDSINDVNILEQTLNQREKIVVEYDSLKEDNNKILGYVWIDKPNPKKINEMLNFKLVQYDTIKAEIKNPNLKYANYFNKKSIDNYETHKSEISSIYDGKIPDYKLEPLPTPRKPMDIPAMSQH